MGPVPRGILNVTQYTDLHTKKAYLSVNSGDNCVAKEDGRPCLIRNILYTESVFLLVVEYFNSGLCSKFLLSQPPQYWKSVFQ